MRFICHDCGYEIPEDMDFCPRCGCVRDKSTPVNDQGYPMGVCPQCGAARSASDVYCGSCGAKLPDMNQYRPYVPVKMRKYGSLALMLALIPGFFNIFGLGHLLMRKWSKGLMYIAISVIIWYLCGWTFVSSNLMVTFLSIAVFFFQAMDIFRVIYTPED